MLTMKSFIPFVFCIFIPILTILRLFFISLYRNNQFEELQYQADQISLQPKTK